MAIAEQRYVTDNFEITLRTGPSGNHAIQRMIKSGAALEVLEQDEENGYSLVRTNGGVEGWVLSRYLMREPAARVQLENLVKQVTNKEPQNASIRNQLNLIKTEYENVNNRITHLVQEKKQLQDQLNEIKSTAANVLAIDAENKQLHQKFVEAKSELKTLQEQYSALNNSNEKDWFITGALVLLGGLLLGLIIPKISWQRRSRYGSF
ncbi:MAG: TIGR04211 family SH3 domain-containing protein [Burkholderiales bacterium]|nr:TIGR04211 family SH3 domain-containing protein [Nitrosomonas sp.]MCP5274743.1 TIGR04211 family SH3 domain-containing protein [Burkholderiales bacterium]